jgi:hypothetical protein
LPGGWFGVAAGNFPSISFGIYNDNTMTANYSAFRNAFFGFFDC